MNWIAGSDDPTLVTNHQIWMTVGAGGVIGLLVGFLLAWGTGKIVLASRIDDSARDRYLGGDMWINLLLLIPLAGAAGVIFIGPLIALLGLLLIAVKIGRLYRMLSRERRIEIFSSLGWLAFLFLISGFAALVYQIVWERVLFAAFGVNIESITIVVSLFMFGLGLGSLAGGMLVPPLAGTSPVDVSHL